MMPPFPHGMQVSNIYQIVHFKFHQTMQKSAKFLDLMFKQQIMLFITSIDVYQQELPDLLFQILPKSAQKSIIEDFKIKNFEIKDPRLSQIVYFKFCQIVIKNAKNHKIEPFGLNWTFDIVWHSKELKKFACRHRNSECIFVLFPVPKLW